MAKAEHSPDAQNLILVNFDIFKHSEPRSSSNYYVIRFDLNLSSIDECHFDLIWFKESGSAHQCLYFVTFEQLLSSPNNYKGKEITIEGFIFLGFETMVLSEELKHSGYAEGHLIPGVTMLWIEGGIPIDIHDELYEQHMVGPSERYGKVLVRGIFQHGGQYGHLGAYRYQISPLEIQLLSWSPSQ